MSRPITREFFGAPDNSARKESALTAPDTGNGRSLGIRLGPGHSPNLIVDNEGDTRRLSTGQPGHSDEYILDSELESLRREQQEEASRRSPVVDPELLASALSAIPFQPPHALDSPPGSLGPEISLPGTPRAEDALLPPPMFQLGNESKLSLDEVTGG